MKKPDLRFWRNPRLRYGGLSTLLLCVALALLIALNALFSALESRHGWRVDCSFNSITTYSDVTEEVIAALDTPVSIYALYERGQEDQPLLELLDRYCAASTFLTWAQTPLSLYVRSEPFLMGQLSFAGIGYFLSFAAIFLALTIHRLDSRRYRGA